MNSFLNKLPLAGRLTLLIAGGTTLILLLILGYSHDVVMGTIFQKTSERNQTVAENIAERIENELSWAQSVVQSNIDEFSSLPLTRVSAADLIDRTLHFHPGLYGMAVALAPDRTSDSTGFRILYGYRPDKKSQAFVIEERDNPEQDYREDWFYLPYYLKRGVWADPYYDSFANVDMITYSAPLLDQDRRVVAVLTCDLTTDFINHLVERSEQGESGSPFIITREGVFVAHPVDSYVRRESLFSLAEDSAYKAAGLEASTWALGRRLIEEDSGFIRYAHPNTHRPVWMHFKRIPSMGGSAGIFFTESEMLQETMALNRMTFMMALIGVFLLAVLGVLIAYSIARPLRKLTDVAAHFAVGEFSYPVPHLPENPEIQSLGLTFLKMRDELQSYIKQLTTATAAKEKIASELAIARDIQMGIVPKLFPPFPDHPHIDLYAKLDPALEVGGDLYDFALLDDNHIYIAIGDVSGKGVPASLLMAVGKTLLKSAILGYRDPAKSVTSTNREIAEHNDACMFITLFCGVLNLSTGELVYVNAGHNPPLILRSYGQSVEMLSVCHGPAVGVVPSARYESSTVYLMPGDLLFLYTDGITEAMSADMKIYGEERLVQWAQEHGALNATDFILDLYENIHEYSRGIAQWDDMTALALRFTAEMSDLTKHPEIYRHHAPNRLCELPGIQRWIETVCMKSEVVLPVIAKMQFMAEEWFVNIVNHAFPEGDRTEQVGLYLCVNEHEIWLRFEDSGIPFDLLAYTPIAIDAPLEERLCGGLGIRFLLETADRILYERKENKNCVTFVKKRHPKPGEQGIPVRETERRKMLQMTEQGGLTIIEMPSQLDINNAPDLENQFMDMIIGGQKHLVCDFAQTRYISSAGLRVILAAARKIAFAKGSITLTQLPPEVYAPFALAGFDKIIDIFPKGN